MRPKDAYKGKRRGRSDYTLNCSGGFMLPVTQKDRISVRDHLIRLRHINHMLRRLTTEWACVAEVFLLEWDAANGYASICFNLCLASVVATVHRLSKAWCFNHFGFEFVICAERKRLLISILSRTLKHVVVDGIKKCLDCFRSAIT